MWYFYQLTCSVRLLWCGCNKVIQLAQVWLCVGGERQPCLRSVQSQQTKPWLRVDIHVLCNVANSYEATPSAFRLMEDPFFCELPSPETFFPL